MNVFTEKDKKRNLIMFIVLGCSLLLVPFATNPGVRMCLTILLLILFLNFILIITKVISYFIKKKSY